MGKVKSFMDKSIDDDVLVPLSTVMELLREAEDMIELAASLRELGREVIDKYGTCVLVASRLREPTNTSKQEKKRPIGYSPAIEDEKTRRAEVASKRQELEAKMLVRRMVRGDEE